MLALDDNLPVDGDAGVGLQDVGGLEVVADGEGEVGQGTGDRRGNADGLLGKELGRQEGPHAGVCGVEGSVVALEGHGLEQDQAVVLAEEVDAPGRIDVAQTATLQPQVIC